MPLVSFSTCVVTPAASARATSFPSARLAFERVADEPAERRVVVDVDGADRVVCP